jgi:hypothetical protein
VLAVVHTALKEGEIALFFGSTCWLELLRNKAAGGRELQDCTHKSNVVDEVVLAGVAGLTESEGIKEGEETKENGHVLLCAALQLWNGGARP